MNNSSSELRYRATRGDSIPTDLLSSTTKRTSRPDPEFRVRSDSTKQSTVMNHKTTPNFFWRCPDSNRSVAFATTSRRLCTPSFALIAPPHALAWEAPSTGPRSLRATTSASRSPCQQQIRVGAKLKGVRHRVEGHGTSGAAKGRATEGCVLKKIFDADRRRSGRSRPLKQRVSMRTW